MVKKVEAGSDMCHGFLDVQGRDTQFDGVQKVYVRRPFNPNEIFIFISELNATRI